MKILIVGGGSVGLGIASCLIKSGNNVSITARKETCEKLHSNGLLRSGVFGEYKAGPELFNAYITVSEVPKEQYDYILVCTKSFDTRPAAEELGSAGRLVSDETRIVLFQNGYGNFEIFSRRFGICRG